MHDKTSLDCSVTLFYLPFKRVKSGGIEKVQAFVPGNAGNASPARIAVSAVGPGMGRDNIADFLPSHTKHWDPLLLTNVKPSHTPTLLLSSCHVSKTHAG